MPRAVARESQAGTLSADFALRAKSPANRLDDQQYLQGFVICVTLFDQDRYTRLRTKCRKGAMTPIIAGRFEQQNLADQAVVALLRRGFAVEDVTAFVVNASGQRMPTREDAVDERYRNRSTANGSADRGLERRSGILVAARAPDYAKRVVAVNVLETMGAQDVERAQGTWEQGRWVDFNPSQPPRRVDLPSSPSHAITG